MNRFSVVVVPMLVWVLVSPIAAEEVATATPLETWGRLRVEGRQLVSEQGQPVQLRGVSSYDISGTDWIFGDQQLGELVSEFKADVLRVVIEVNPRTGLINPLVPDTIDRLILATEQAGLYCIVDWWDQLRPQGYPETAAAFFGGLAKKYQDKKHLLFEIFDETAFADVTWDGEIRPYAEVVRRAVRKIDDARILLVGCADYGRDIELAAANPLPDSQILYTFHWSAGSTGPRERSKVTTAMQTVPVFNSVWSLTNLTEGGMLFPDEAAVWLEFLDSHGVSSTSWSFSVGFGESKGLLNFYDGEMPLKEALSPAGLAMFDYLTSPRHR